MFRLWILFVALFSFGLMSCTTSPGKVATEQLGEIAPGQQENKDQFAFASFLDRELPVATWNRDLRACFMSVIMSEMEAAVARRVDPNIGNAALGRLNALEAAVKSARTADPLWLNSVLADVQLTFYRALINLTKAKAYGFLRRGLSADAIIYGVRNVAVDLIKGRAAFLDVKIQLEGLIAGKYTKTQLWKSCEGRIAYNRALLLSVVSGVLQPPPERGPVVPVTIPVQTFPEE